MGSVIINVSMSLDGYIAGPRHEMAWIFDRGFWPAGPVPAIDAVIASTGAILVGRGTYDVGQASQREETSGLFGGRWSGAEFVLTNRPLRAGNGPKALSGDIRDAVATALAAAGGKNLLLLGANVVQQSLDAGLVDELVLFVLPILLGDGIRLFAGREYRETLFETVDVGRAGQGAILHLTSRTHAIARPSGPSDSR